MAKRNAQGPRHLWFVCFTFDEVRGEQCDRGRFQIIVHAADPDAALAACEKRIRRARRSKALFDTPTTIYLDHLIQVQEGVDLADALLVNIVIETGESRGEILCALPERSGRKGVGAYGVEEERHGEDDEVPIEPFVDFGGREALAALRP